MSQEEQLLNDIDRAYKSLSERLMARKRPDAKSLETLNVALNCLDRCTQYVRSKSKEQP